MGKFRKWFRNSASGSGSGRARELPDPVPKMYFQVRDLEVLELLWLNTVKVNDLMY